MVGVGIIARIGAVGRILVVERGLAPAYPVLLGGVDLVRSAVADA